jgi:hypothetical protein
MEGEEEEDEEEMEIEVRREDDDWNAREEGDASSGADRCRFVRWDFSRSSIDEYGFTHSYSFILVAAALRTHVQH